MNDERFLELASEFVLSGLDGPELEAFEAELARRGEEGQRRVARLREAAASLAWSAPSVRPPDGLREKLLAMVDAQQPDDGDVAGGSDVAGGRDVAGGGRPAPRAWQLASGLAAAAAVSLAVWNADLRDELRRLRSTVESLETTLASADSAAEALHAVRGDLLTTASPRARVFDLTGTDVRPGARARVFIDTATGRVLLFAYELPILPPDSVYQLWSIRDGRPLSAGTFTARDAGPARLELDSLETIEGADALAVTVEPAPGREAPTGPMVLQTSL